MTDKTEQAEDVKETAAEQDKTEPTLKQSEVNALMAKERKQYEAKIKVAVDEFTALKKSIDDANEARETAAKEKVALLREGLPEGIVNLLDKLTATDQLEWLSDPTNTITKQTIKPLPEARTEGGRLPSIGTIV